MSHVSPGSVRTKKMLKLSHCGSVTETGPIIHPDEETTASPVDALLSGLWWLLVTVAASSVGGETQRASFKTPS
jgi:hypothetical protein